MAFSVNLSLYSTGSPFGLYNIKVGTPWIFYSSISFKVDSISANIILLLAYFNFSANLRYLGSNFLQCGHQLA